MKSGNGKVGQPFEDIFVRILRIRILSMHLKENSKSGTTNLMEIFGINRATIVQTAEGLPYKRANMMISKNPSYYLERKNVRMTVKRWTEATFESYNYAKVANSKKKEKDLNILLNAEIVLPDAFDFDDIESSSNREEWKKQIKNIDSSIGLYKTRATNGGNEDHCDLMMFVKMRKDGNGSPKNMVIAIETKSRGESSYHSRGSEGVWRGHFSVYEGEKKTSDEYAQYFQFCNAVSSITDVDLVGDCGYLRALMEGNFLYVYATTHDGPNVHLTPEDLKETTPKPTSTSTPTPIHSQGILVLSREISKNILGFTFDFYALTRSIVNKG